MKLILTENGKPVAVIDNIDLINVCEIRDIINLQTQWN